MKSLITLIFLVFCSASFSQTKIIAKNSLATSKYKGFYSFGTSVEKGKVGTIQVYSETDSTILFCIDLNRGAPSYNMGFLYGRLKIIKDSGMFYFKDTNLENGCKWSFKFSKYILKIKTLENMDDCGFGGGVFADGIYKRISSKTQNYFQDGEGRKFYFKKTKPEDYYKE